MIHYLHDSILYDTEKNTLVCINAANVEVIINSKNWHTHLDIIGWTKLPLNVIKFIGTYTDQIYHNSPYGIIDCGGSGDCLFHCISVALTSCLKDYYESHDIRKIVSGSIDDEIFDTIIGTYRVLKDSGDFDENWDPYEIECKEQLHDLINEGGNNYWGDHIMFQLIIKALEINILILRINNITNEYGIYPTYHEYDPANKTIILLYEDEFHFKLVGFFKDNMTTFFKDEDIPPEIKRIYSII